MKKLVDLLKDLLKSIIYGLIVTVIISVIIGLIAIIVKKGSISGAFEVIRSALLILGSFGLLLCAILILKKKSEKPFEHIEQWKEKFSIFSYKIVLGNISIVILLCGIFIDWILFYKI